MHFESFRSYDDTVLAAHWAGEGDLAIVLANGLGGTFTAWQPMVEAFRDRCRFYSWDYRGLYRSERPRDPGTLSIDGHVRDLRALMDHFGLEKAVIAGWSMGVQLGLEYYRQSPERVQGMILLNGTYGSLFRTAFRNPMSRFVLPPFVRLARSLSPMASAVVHSFARWELTVPLAASLRLVDPRIDRGVFHGIAREFAHLDMETYLQTMIEANRHDAGDVLGDVEVPVLVIAGDRDTMTPQAVTDRMMKEIHGAELFVVPRGTHYCLLEYPELISLRLEKFLREHFGIDGERHEGAPRRAGGTPRPREATSGRAARGASIGEAHQRAMIAAETEVAHEAQRVRGNGRSQEPGRPEARPAARKAKPAARKAKPAAAKAKQAASKASRTKGAPKAKTATKKAPGARQATRRQKAP